MDSIELDDVRDEGASDALVNRGAANGVIVGDNASHNIVIIDD
jgi:hypothetical protein